MHWFTRGWWKYLLAPKLYKSDYWWTVILCRMKGHPCGIIFVNPQGDEPDYHCKNCGDDLG
jgi:hypothetical protein